VQVPQAASKGAISKLQEFVQCSDTFHIPSNYPVLQWTFESKMADAATLEFRAFVAFLLEGVPHHVAGTWQPKKKDAQRDAAERALGLFTGKRSDKALQGERSSSSAPLHIPRLPYTTGSGAPVQLSEEELLEEHCRHSDACSSSPPCWSVCWAGDKCQAIIKMALLGVPHQFAGAAHSSEHGARADAARRVLWYLQIPGFQDAYEPDPLATAIVTRKIPSPPANWAHDSVTEGALEVAERKTAIMRVQNRLQQTFSHELRPGLSVWSWTYEMESNDEGWPVLCRASVKIPVIGKTFRGNWIRGQRDAQLDTVRQVTLFLDELESSL